MLAGFTASIILEKRSMTVTFDTDIKLCGAFQQEGSQFLEQLHLCILQ